MTPEKAADRAAEILAIAEHAENDRAIALVAVGDGWTRLHTALANSKWATLDATGLSLPVSISAPEAVMDGDPAQIARDIARAMGMPVREEVEPEPLGYTVVQMVNGSGLLPPDTEDLETREEAVARQKWLAGQDPLNLAARWVACKVVPLDDEEQA